MDKLQQVPLVGEEGKEPGSAAGQLAEEDEDEPARRRERTQQGGSRRPRSRPAGAVGWSCTCQGRPVACLERAVPSAGGRRPHLGPPVCFAEPDPAGAGAARVRLQDGTAVSPSKACVLAVGERSRLSNDRLTRVKQAKKKRKSPDEAA